MRSKWEWPSTTTLFGEEWRLEPPGQRPYSRVYIVHEPVAGWPR